jgi:hypothetical protein
MIAIYDFMRQVMTFKRFMGLLAGVRRPRVLDIVWCNNVLFGSRVVRTNRPSLATGIDLPAGDDFNL